MTTPHFSCRMVNILKALNTESTQAEYDEAKQLLEKHDALFAQLGEYEPKTEEQKEAEIKDQVRYWHSISLRQIIIGCEGLTERVKAFYDKDGHILYSRCGTDFRHQLSLAEILADRVFPKGRALRHGLTSDKFEGYTNAYFDAKMLQATYTRTLNKMVAYGLLEKFHSDRSPCFNVKETHYVITQKGRETLAILTENSIDNTSQSTSISIEAKTITAEVKP